MPTSPHVRNWTVPAGQLEHVKIGPALCIRAWQEVPSLLNEQLETYPLSNPRFKCVSSSSTVLSPSLLLTTIPPSTYAHVGIGRHFVNKSAKF